MERFHLRDPAPRQPIGAPLVEGGDDIVLQQIVQRRRLHLVLVLGVVVALAASDGPADERASRRWPLCQASSHQPSSVLKFSAPLASAFMPLVPLASSGRRGVFSQTSDALHQVARHGHVVVFQKHQPAAEFRLLRQS